MKYDYIIAGSGCAGLSLLYKILQTPSLQNKSILVIDKDQKVRTGFNLTSTTSRAFRIYCICQME